MGISELSYSSILGIIIKEFGVDRVAARDLYKLFRVLTSNFKKEHMSKKEIAEELVSFVRDRYGNEIELEKKCWYAEDVAKEYNLDVNTIRARAGKLRLGRGAKYFKRGFIIFTEEEVLRVTASKSSKPTLPKKKEVVGRYNKAGLVDIFIRFDGTETYKGTSTLEECEKYNVCIEKNRFYPKENLPVIPLERYSVKSTSRKNFKKMCKDRSVEFSNFIETRDYTRKKGFYYFYQEKK